MTVTWQSIITFAAVLTAMFTIIGCYNKVFKFVEQQKKQEEEIKASKEERTLLTYGILACLKGLKEKGCNGPVTEAIDKIEKHMNLMAHQ